MNTILDAIKHNDEWGMFANEDNTRVIPTKMIVVDCGLCYRFYTQKGVYIPGNKIDDAMVIEAVAAFNKE